MAALLKSLTVLLFVNIANCIPIIQPCQPEILAQPATIVGTTIVDNSVSNALANALQLLIVSNLIENTINVPGCCASNILPAVTPICETIPIRAPICSLAYDIIPECIPCNPYNPIPFDLFPSRGPVEVIPNLCCPEILPNPPCYDIVPEFAYNIGPNCGIHNIPGPNIAIPCLPNIGCGCNNIAYDCYPCIYDKSPPIVSEMIFPPPIQVPCNCGHGLPNHEVCCNPWGYY